ncbi:hypothetical protein [Azohydromonas caseinilytica]|uniref:Uncharacterized protein n=1 Tax=Azohydromonas caseinilytica TaxID=2728836 RepID=A0A848FCW0_9BURK|nr:hypothetical protein [Azohydromonas caseinilytica]NML17142.1 hypothetical protein [Azohydromonas caseinilytica]
MKPDRVVDISLIKDAAQPTLRVTVPRGTALAETVKLQPIISDILGKLKGCPACTSGMPIWIQEREEIENIVRVDLDRMQPI